MKKTLISIVLTVGVLAGFSQNHIQCNWQKTKPVIDGHNTEWGTYLPNYNSSSLVAYNMTNDSQYLYLVFMVNNRIMERKIMQGGMQLKIKTKSLGKNPAVVSFPVPQKRGKAKPSGQETTNTGEHKRPDFSKFREIFVSGNINFLTQGFSSENGQFTLPKSEGIVPALNWDSTEMYYEVKIPLSEIFGKNFNLAEATKKKFRVFLEIPAAISGQRPDNSEGRPSQTEGRETPANDRPQMNQGQFTGGSPGMGNMQNDENYEILTTTQTLKVRVKLTASANQKN